MLMRSWCEGKPRRVPPPKLCSNSISSSVLRVQVHVFVALDDDVDDGRVIANCVMWIQDLPAWRCIAPEAVGEPAEVRLIRDVHQRGPAKDPELSMPITPLLLRSSTDRQLVDGA